LPRGRHFLFLTEKLRKKKRPRSSRWWVGLDWGNGFGDRGEEWGERGGEKKGEAGGATDTYRGDVKASAIRSFLFANSIFWGLGKTGGSFLKARAFSGKCARKKVAKLQKKKERGDVSKQGGTPRRILVQIVRSAKAGLGEIL